jgi:hypothetical protein
MIHPRIAFASGVAAIAAAALMLSGRIDGSLVLAVVLVVVARAGPLAARADGVGGARSLARQSAVIPAWVGIALAASLRAGSVALGDVRGAHAVGGLAIARGSVLLVVGAWLAAAAGALAIVAILDDSSESPEMRAIEWIAVAAQAALVVTLVAGPQIRGLRDVGPWVVGAVAAFQIVWFGRRIATKPWVPSAAIVLAAAALGCALGGGSL